MNKELRDKIIEADLGWLKTMTVHEVDGKLMLGGETGELPFNVSYVMKEEEFIRKWLVSFAVGSVGGKIYLNRAEWYKLTYNGTRAVMVVKQNQETGKFTPVLLVPPLISHNLTEEDFMKLRMASVMIYNNHHDTMKTNNINASLEIAQKLTDEQIGLQAKPTTLTDLINPEYYAKHHIVPVVEQTLIWIRDVIRAGRETNPADIDRARSILYRDHKGEKVTKEEYQFIGELSLGDFDVDAKLQQAQSENRLDGAPAPVQKGSDNPLEC